MGIHGLSKVIGDNAPAATKEQEIKNYFGMYLFGSARGDDSLTTSLYRAQGRD